MATITSITNESSFCDMITNRIDHFENHTNVLTGLHGLVDTAKSLHAEERSITLLSVRLVGLLIEQNGAGNYLMSQAKFAHHIGLTENMFWKRAQAYRVLKNYPEFIDLVTSGQTCVSHVAMLAAKITPENSGALLKALPFKSIQDVRDLVARITPDGQELSDKETFIDIKLRFTKEEMALMERAREVLAHSGHVPSNEEMVLKAFADLLDRRDPLRKAERAAQKSTSLKKATATVLSTGIGAVVTGASALKQRGVETATINRPKIPAAVRHSVWLRDQGKCTYKFSDGTPCGTKMMLEVDHRTPWARGGEHSEENLTLRCREHNMWEARCTYGQEFMHNKQQAQKQAVYPAVGF